jgi:hypothetical protein
MRPAIQKFGSFKIHIASIIHHHSACRKRHEQYGCFDKCYFPILEIAIVRQTIIVVQHGMKLKSSFGCMEFGPVALRKGMMLVSSKRFCVSTFWHTEVVGKKPPSCSKVSCFPVMPFTTSCFYLKH